MDPRLEKNSVQAVNHVHSVEDVGDGDNMSVVACCRRRGS